MPVFLFLICMPSDTAAAPDTTVYAHNLDDTLWLSPPSDPALCVIEPRKLMIKESCEGVDLGAVSAAFAPSFFIAVYRAPEGKAIIHVREMPKAAPDAERFVRTPLTLEKPYDGMDRAVNYLFKGDPKSALIVVLSKAAASDTLIKAVEPWLTNISVSGHLRVKKMPGLTTGSDARPQIPTHVVASVRGKKGVILMRIRINEKGVVDDAEVVRSSIHELDDVMTNHCKALRYQQTILDGRPVKVEIMQPFSFVF